MMENIKNILYKFEKDELFDKFYFIGGTALSSYLDHRISYDIDLISDKKLDKILLNKMVIKYDAKFIPDINESVFKINTGEELRDYKLQFMINDIKVEFFYPNDGIRVEILKKYKNDCDSFCGIKRLSLKAISELKLIALFNRSEIRDLFDIFYLFYKNIITCNDIDRFLSLKYPKTFVEFLDQFNDNSGESLDFLENQEFSYLKNVNKMQQVKELFKEEYIKRCI